MAERTTGVCRRSSRQTPWWAAGRDLEVVVAILAVAVLSAASPIPGHDAHVASGTQEARCADARRFLEDTVGMATITEPDTLDDWRTHTRLPACRVTAAGTTTRTIADEAAHFYETLRGAGWTRTPEPRDAPNEASLRFRRGDTDCLFNVYTGGLLGTDAELAVDARRVPQAGELRWNVLVLCTEALPAALQPPD